MIGGDGRPATFPQSDGKGGVVELPMAMPAGVPTPCAVCPKVLPGREPCPENAAEFEPWVSDLLAHFAECRAVGDFGDADPLTRALARVWSEAVEARREADLARLVGRGQ